MTIEALERRGRPEGLHNTGPAVRETERRALARNEHNPLWEKMVRGFEREWSIPWNFMDSAQRGIVRFMYKHEKKIAKSKPETRPTPEPIRTGPWDPAPSLVGK